jgi:hypothetical protein
VTVSADGGVDSTNKTEDGDVTVNCGALRILKESSKTGEPLGLECRYRVLCHGPVVFHRDRQRRRGRGLDERRGVSLGAMAGEYSLSETMPPAGYGDGTATTARRPW